MDNRNRRNVIWILTGIVLAAALIVILLAGKHNTMTNDIHTEAAETITSTETALETETEKNQDTERIEQQGESSNQVNGLTFPVDIPGTGLKMIQIGKYTGPFLEDGSDEPMTNVTAIVVENTSDQTVQYAELVFQVNEEETAVFRLTTIPPNSSVQVLESGKRAYSSEDRYQYQDVVYTEMPQLSLMEDDLKITALDGKLVVENLTDEDLGMVYVRYKYFLKEDFYQGGITYETKFFHVGPRTVVEKEAPHFKQGGSRLMMAGNSKEENVSE